MNKWKEVANMFDLELNEKFRFEGYEEEYLFTKDGLCFISKYHEFKKDDSEILLDLLSGKIRVIKKPWKPKNGEVYYHFFFTNDVGKSAIWQRWTNSWADYINWKTGNCFRTKEEAKSKGEEIMEQIKKEFEEA